MPKYFSGNLSAGNKLFRTPAEIRADKIAKQTRQNLKTSQSALDQSGKNTKKSFANKDKKSLPHVNTKNKNYRAYENATTDTEKLRYGKAYLRDTFSNKYDDFLDLIENSIVDEKMGLSPETNPFVRFMDKNDHINNFNGKKDLSQTVFDAISDDKDIVDDMSSFIYNEKVQSKINTISSDRDREKFILLTSILSDEDKSSRYFDNITKQQRIDLINEIAEKDTYSEMRTSVDNAQKKYNKQEEEPRQESPKEVSKLIAKKNADFDRTLKSILADDRSKAFFENTLKKLGFKGDSSSVKREDIKNIFSKSKIDKLTGVDKINAEKWLQILKGKQAEKR